jgi:hypothetical protein
MDNDNCNFNYDYAEECDYNHLKKQITGVLRKYFEYNDNGDPNPEYDENLSPVDAIDEIHDIIGDI